MIMFMRFCELDLSSLKMGNSCPSLNLVTDVNYEKNKSSSHSVSK